MAAPNTQKRYNYILSADNGSSGAKNLPAKAERSGTGAKDKIRKRKKTKEPGLRFYDGDMDSLFFVIIIV